MADPSSTPPTPPDAEHVPLVRALENKLALAEARYRGLVEHVPAVAYVAEWDAQSTLTYVSPQIEELLGWPPEAFLADQDLWYRCIHPGDIDRIREQERVAFEAGTWADMEFRMIHRDGSERWVRDKEAIIRDADGTPRFSQGVLVDVTPTRATESELQDERHRAQRYLDIAGAIIVILDASAKITLVNRAGIELLGYAESELIGRDWYEAVVPERLRGAGGGG
jgi:PAS domain S-box-containing protein